MIKFLPDWKKVLREAWSIRFILLAMLFSAASVFLSLTDAKMLGLDPMAFAALSGLISAFAFVARLLAQGKD